MEQMFIGSTSNSESIRNEAFPYSDGGERVYVPFEGMSGVNLVIGAMGRGKTNLLKNVVASRPNANMIIHDPKGEYNQCLYDGTKDMIFEYHDARSVIWDVFAEIKKDRQIGELIWRNMLLSVRGEGNKEGEEWVIYAVSWLMRLSAEIVDKNIAREDIAAEIIRLYKKFEAEIGGQASGMKSVEIGTAAPIFNLLSQMYDVGIKDNRCFVTIEDITKSRRVFLCRSYQSSSTLDTLNNALLACLINTYLSRPNIPREETGRYVYFILDEFLTFKLDQNSETALLTLCRSKGTCVWLGMQHLPLDKHRLTHITASRYVTAVFRLDDAYTREEVEKLLGGEEILKITKEVFSELSPYVAFLEINDFAGRHRTFVKPCCLRHDSSQPKGDLIKSGE